MDKNFKAVWAVGFIVFSSMLGGMVVFTDSYDDVLQIPGISVIGHMTEASAGTKFITLQENEIELQSRGWNAP